ncbi:MAG TPA: DUF3300 domain-containing protein [Pyrinomonadaceae bacterium]|jgi:hypothetical protein
MKRGKSSFQTIQGRLAIAILCGAAVLALEGQAGVAIAQTTVTETPAQLQQLVAPLALYPDNLVAEILTASTYPSQIVEADHWLVMRSDLGSERLAVQADQQWWDSSVKALTAFPSVLANLDMNLSWTMALGNAYLDEPRSVLDAIQIMRQRAQSAGNLQSTPQQRVTTERTTIVIEPVAPDICYLPYFDPWIVYGAPLDIYPGYIYEPWYGPPYVAFGPGIAVGFFGRFGWGWPAWGFNWNQRVVVFNRVPFFSRSPFFLRGTPGGFRETFRPEFRETFRPGLRFHSFGEGRTVRGFGGFRGAGRH